MSKELFQKMIDERIDQVGQQPFAVLVNVISWRKYLVNTPLSEAEELSYRGVRIFVSSGLTSDENYFVEEPDMNWVVIYKGGHVINDLFGMTLNTEDLEVFNRKFEELTKAMREALRVASVVRKHAKETATMKLKISSEEE